MGRSTMPLRCSAPRPALPGLPLGAGSRAGRVSRGTEGTATRAGAGTRRGAGADPAVPASPFASSAFVTSCGARVATTGREWIAAGGFTAGPVAGITLAATGLTSSAPRTGLSWCTSTSRIRATLTWPWPNFSAGTPTTALVTFTFLYTVMFVTFTVVCWLMTTLLTTRGPPQPCHDATPMKPGRPHHGTTGSPQPSGAQQSGRTPTPTLTPPRNTTRAGAYTGRTMTGPGAHAQ